MKPYSVFYARDAETTSNFFTFVFDSNAERAQGASEITNWCEQQFGQRTNGRWDGVVTHPTAAIFVLKCEIAAATFRLFWA